MSVSPLQFQRPEHLTQLNSLPPLSLYVHIPWCLRKCPYCDFNSHALPQGSEAEKLALETRYIDSLITDVELALPSIWGRRINSIFFGGGTPSLLSPAALDRLLLALHARLKINPDAEITLEANPGTFEAERFRAYRASGINRLSVGIQSFDAEKLQRLGRVHDGEQARRALEIAGQHFDNFNVDLMYALPAQSLSQAICDIETALSFGPTHLSAYHLTLEPNTLFAAQPPADLPDDELSADMQQAIEQRLAQAGFEHYETSAFCLPQQPSRHNLNYWTFGDYLGIGAGAHSKLSFHDKIVRQMRVKQPQAYLAAIEAGQPVQTDHVIAADDLAFEFMMNALRLNHGFAKSLFHERTGLSISAILYELDAAQQRGLLTHTAQDIIPTQQGRRFLNDLLAIFLPD